MSAGPQQVGVFQDGVGVGKARVVVNGVQLASTGDGYYIGNVTPTVPVGGQVTIVVTVDTLIATGIGTVPGVATIASASPANRGNPITVDWVAATSPDSFYVGLNYWVNGVGSASSIRTAGTTREALISTGDVPLDATNISISLFGYNIGTFSGHVAAGSNMRVRTLTIDRPYTFGVP